MKGLVVLLILHGVSGKEITVNSDKIVSMRDGEHTGQYIDDDVGCVINTNDGKFISVVETCAAVRQLIGEQK